MNCSIKPQQQISICCGHPRQGAWEGEIALCLFGLSFHVHESRAYNKQWQHFAQPSQGKPGFPRINLPKFPVLCEPWNLAPAANDLDYTYNLQRAKGLNHTKTNWLASRNSAILRFLSSKDEKPQSTLGSTFFRDSPVYFTTPLRKYTFSRFISLPHPAVHNKGGLVAFDSYWKTS